MSKPGRPLHFLSWVLGGWVTLRAATLAAPLLWQTTAPSAMPIAANAAPMLSGLPLRDAKALIALAAPMAALPRPSTQQASAPAPTSGMERQAQPAESAVASSGATEPARGIGNPPAAPIATVSARLPAQPDHASPWSVTGWMLWRRDVSGGLAQGPLLGGSQAGLRLDYRLWRDGTRSLALYGRVTRAIERPFAEEAALGVAVRPVPGLPVALMAERRERLGTGGRNGFALLAAGGIGPRPVVPRVEVEGYAQAGIVGLPGADGFADGKASLAYRLTAPVGQPDLALGLSLSGSTQPGASRVDIGPELRLRLPVAGGHLRLSAEWRERVSGDARPARGPAITLVADF